MGTVEPPSLSVVRALTRNLEMQPCLGFIFGSEVSVAELVLGIVVIDEVFHDRAGFPECYVFVGVFDGGETAVGV